MKKKLPIILLGVILACVLVFGFLYANNDIGKTANSLEADIRQSQKILDDWIVDGSISDTMAAFISYPQDKTDHTFSVYVNRPGLSFGYFFRGGGDIVEVDDYIAEFVVEGNNERAFISMNELCDYGVDESLIRKISKRSGIPYADPDEPDEEISLKEAQPKKPGLFSSILMGMALAGSPKPKNTGKCTGDCAHCPPHYGYRYGRWYYGHGHTHGCEFCGNGGCSGKCNID